MYRQERGGPIKGQGARPLYLEKHSTNYVQTLGEGWRVKSSIHFYCALHAKRGERVQIACKNAYVINKRPRSARCDIDVLCTLIVSFSPVQTLFLNILRAVPGVPMIQDFMGKYMYMNICLVRYLALIHNKLFDVS